MSWDPHHWDRNHLLACEIYKLRQPAGGCFPEPPPNEDRLISVVFHPSTSPLAPYVAVMPYPNPLNFCFQDSASNLFFSKTREASKKNADSIVT